jgi:uncharacterized protein (TIGR04255 family)
MPERQHYPKAPIIEAVIDFHVTPNQDFTHEKLVAFPRTIKQEYPKSEGLIEGKLEFTNDGKNPKPEVQRTNIGYRVTSHDGKYKVTPRLAGFALSVFPPYDRWETFRDEAKRLWQIYCEIAEPTCITRAAVRYINRIEIPIPAKPQMVEQEDYFETYPQISKKYPYKDVRDLFMRVSIPQQDIDALLIFHEIRVPPKSQEELISIMLDFDLFGARSENPWAIDNNDVWEYLELLHNRKNVIFEDTITEKTRELLR